MTTQTERVSAAWSRLQALSCAHAARMGPQGGRYDRRGRRYGTSVPREIEENVEILGRGSEEEIKARVLWYVTFEPGIFKQCSAVWNA